MTDIQTHIQFILWVNTSINIDYTGYVMLCHIMILFLLLDFGEELSDKSKSRGNDKVLSDLKLATVVSDGGQKKKLAD